MTGVRHRQPGERWERSRPSVSLGSSMPVRTVTDDPDPKFRHRPVGFTADPEPTEEEPDLWEGDQA